MTNDKDFKFDFEGHFKDAAIIQANIHPEIEYEYEQFRATATETHLIDNRNFGLFIARQFAEMLCQDRDRKAMLFESTNHTMSIGLCIKVNGEENAYVVKFFDPNSTTHQIRSKSSSLEMVEKQSLASYIGNEALQCYYRETRGTSLIHVFDHNPDRNAQSTLNETLALRKLSTMECEIDGTVLYHLMDNGFAGNLDAVREKLSTLGLNEQCGVLAAENPIGVSGLAWALKYGHASVVEEYGKLLDQIPPDRRAQFLIAENEFGTPGLYHALVDGHAATVEAYSTLVARIPNTERAQLLSANLAPRKPALSNAVLNHQSAAVISYGKLLELVSAEERAVLLASNYENPQFKASFSFRYTDAMKKFLDLERFYGSSTLKYVKSTCNLHQSLSRDRTLLVSLANSKETSPR